MKVAIRYYTRGGNTKKLADAISKAVGVDAETTSVPLTGDVDIFSSEVLFMLMAWTTR